MTLVMNSVSHALLKLLDIDLRRNTGIALPQGDKRIVPPPAAVRHIWHETLHGYC